MNVLLDCCRQVREREAAVVPERLPAPDQHQQLRQRVHQRRKKRRIQIESAATTLRKFFPAVARQSGQCIPITVCDRLAVGDCSLGIAFQPLYIPQLSL